MQESTAKDVPVEIKINNFPFSAKGRIGRLSYFLTNLIMILVFVTGEVIIKHQSKISPSDILFYADIVLFLILLIVNLFSASKRLRDLAWSQWLLLVYILPYVSLVMLIPFLFIKGKYSK